MILLFLKIILAKQSQFNIILFKKTFLVVVYTKTML